MSKTELPSYTISKPELPGERVIIQAYLIFREHWELIDKVFRIESPNVPSKTDRVELTKQLLEENAPFRNPIVLGMMAAIANLQIEEENQTIRKGAPSAVFLKRTILARELPVYPNVTKRTVQPKKKKRK